MKEALMLAVLSTIASLIITPMVRKLAIKINAVDIPKDIRRVHKKPIPLLGGVAIFISFIIGIIFQEEMLNLQETGIILGGTLIIIGGVIDDIKELKPIYKLGFQLSATLVLIFCGLNIKYITNPFTSTELFLNIGNFSIPLTILWIIGVTNAFNLIDGLDGLSAGIGFIASVTLFIIAILNHRYETAIMTAILGGALLGFIPYNFNPASIFMGDAGAQLIGFLLAAISIKGAIKSAAAFSLAVPILAFGLPIYDTLFAMIRRKINGKPIMQADKGHLHHRLLNMGLTQKQAVLIMYLISCILGGVSIIAMQISSQRSYFLTTSVIIAIVLLAWKSGFFKSQ
ncbi:MraY family glycosyltransferase [Hathewaya histolytica]|uniref:UDP-phosphate N-acetylgalactosaminyl-1-phosphate transferase n=1 Tax=Hathewaya histolytica TaxID=1498 RepID=A0A4U9RT59_HATHI|nr:MraY family glycosyltransferase [Hathewaya histolytica]VTQ94153.1 UDP-phosphate N-acetylgalactosaminyl-1-phosphate transferase [Hathewaya histolytica]